MQLYVHITQICEFVQKITIYVNLYSTNIRIWMIYVMNWICFEPVVQYSL